MCEPDVHQEEPYECLVEEDTECEDPVPVLQNEDIRKNPSFFVYLLCTLSGKCTYIGATVNVHRRLRQHNGEIKGGAKYTTRKGPDQWRRVAYVSGFPTWNDALKFEWRWKQLGRKYRKISGGNVVSGVNPSTLVENRLYNLNQLLSMEKPTLTATPYSEWPERPVVHYE